MIVEIFLVSYFLVFYDRVRTDNKKKKNRQPSRMEKSSKGRRFVNTLLPRVMDVVNWQLIEV